MRYVIDATAWIEYFIGSERGKKVKEILDSNENEIFSSIITLTEVVSVTKRENRDAEEKYRDVLNLSNMHFKNLELAKEAGILHSDIKKKIKDFGLADVFVPLTARKLNAKILTGDPHFKTFKEAILI